MNAELEARLSLMIDAGQRGDKAMLRALAEPDEEDGPPEGRDGAPVNKEALARVLAGRDAFIAAKRRARGKAVGLAECDHGPNKGKPGPCPDGAGESGGGKGGKRAAMAEKTRAKIDKVNSYHNEMHGRTVATTERPDSPIFNAPARREAEAKIAAALGNAGQDAAFSYAPYHGTTEIYSDGRHVASIHRDSIGDDGSIEVHGGVGSDMSRRVTLRKEDGDFATEVKLRRVMELPPPKLSKDPEEATRQRQEVADAKARDAAAKEANRAKKAKRTNAAA